mgnify:CR=1 FL=1
MRHFLWWGETPAATAQRRKRRPFRGKTSPLPHPAKQYLKKIVDDNPALYIDEMQQELASIAEKQYRANYVRARLYKQEQNALDEVRNEKALKLRGDAPSCGRVGLRTERIL